MWSSSVSTSWTPLVRTNNGYSGDEVGNLSEAIGKTELTRKKIGKSLMRWSRSSATNQQDAPGMFTVPGLLKLKKIEKPATKARMGINPFTKQEMMFKAKSARNVVKALPLKSLKEMVK